MKTPVVREDGRLARQLRSTFGDMTAREIARHIADGALSSTNQLHPPINITSILQLRRANKCRIVDMQKDARLLTTIDGFTVEIGRCTERRRRFTLAHEIGHTYFYDLKSSPPERTLYDADPKDEETFCNMLASEILMPPHMIQAELKRLEGRDQELSPVDYSQRLARRFEVSIETMTRRLIEDLELFHGIALGSRWFPGLVTKSKPVPTGPAWRLAWWAASREVVTPLYLPYPGNRPKLEIELAEQAYLSRGTLNLRLQLKNVQLGNLKRILESENKGADCIDVWALSERRTNPASDTGATSASATPDLSPREYTEIVLFFPLQ